jgi:hypothetical protein
LFESVIKALENRKRRVTIVLSKDCETKKGGVVQYVKAKASEENHGACVFGAWNLITTSLARNAPA